MPDQRATKFSLFFMRKSTWTGTNLPHFCCCSRAVTEETKPPQRCQVERGHQREWNALLCFRAHEGELVSTSQRTIRTRVSCSIQVDVEHADVPASGNVSGRNAFRSKRWRKSSCKFCPDWHTCTSTGSSTETWNRRTFCATGLTSSNWAISAWPEKFDQDRRLRITCRLDGTRTSTRVPVASDWPRRFVAQVQSSWSFAAFDRLWQCHRPVGRRLYDTRTVHISSLIPWIQRDRSIVQNLRLTRNSVRGKFVNQLPLNGLLSTWNRFNRINGQMAINWQPRCTSSSLSWTPLRWPKWCPVRVRKLWNLLPYCSSGIRPGGLLPCKRSSISQLAVFF